MSVTFASGEVDSVDPVIFGDGRLWVECMGDENYQASLLRRSRLHGG